MLLGQTQGKGHCVLHPGSALQARSGTATERVEAAALGYARTMLIRMVQGKLLTYKMYMMTPRDHMSQDLSYFSGPSTSGAGERKKEVHKAVKDVVQGGCGVKHRSDTSGGRSSNVG